MEEATVTAFPESLVALGTNIPGEFALSRITAVSAFEFILFVFHFLFLSRKNFKQKIPNDIGDVNG
jgi:hypothetical protein